MKRYIEIVEYKTGDVVKRIDVTDMSERTVDKTERGMNINLDHSNYYTVVTDSEVELNII